MGRTAIVLPGLILFGYIFWTINQVTKEHQRELHGNFDHQPHRWNEGLSVNAKLYGDIARICRRPGELLDEEQLHLDRVPYCIGDEPPMPEFVAPFDAVAPGSVKSYNQRRCACVGRLRSAPSSWSVLPEKSPLGTARVVYGLRGDTVERIDATLPLDSYAKLASELVRRHVVRPEQASNGVVRWHRDQSTAELARNAADVRLSLIGGDEHYAVSGRSRPILRAVSSWFE